MFWKNCFGGEKLEEESRYGIEQLVPIVSELAGKYNCYDSTSLSYEKAQQLMEAVLYCIRECDIAGTEGLVGRELNAEEAYRSGLRLIEEKVERTRWQYNRMAAEFCSYGSRCLDDTIRKGIPEFFKWYDVRFDPQNTILTLDYPVLSDLSRYSGIDAVHLYVSYVSLEQKFLHQFPKAYIRGVLTAYSPDFGLLIENLCSIVWQNVIGHGLLKKAFHDPGFSAEECGKLAKNLSGMGIEELKEVFLGMAEEILSSFFEDGEEMFLYFREEISGIAVRIYHAVLSGTVNRIFVW